MVLPSMPLQLQANPGEYTFVLPILDRLFQRPSILYCDICTSSTCWKRKIIIFAQKFCFFFHFFLKIWNFEGKFWIFFRFFYLTSSAAAMSMSMQYFAFGFRPFTIVLYAGNMRLKINISIIISLEIHIFWPKFENFEKKLDIENVLEFFFNFFKFNFYI